MDAMRTPVLKDLHRIAVAALLVLGGCQQPQPAAPALPEASVVGSTAYLIVNAPIVPARRDLFIADVDKFRNVGATEIDLAINSLAAISTPRKASSIT